MESGKEKTLEIYDLNFSPVAADGMAVFLVGWDNVPVYLVSVEQQESPREGA